MVCSQDDGRAIGHAGIDDIDFYDKRGEIFFLIGEKSARGKGYGNELVQLLVDYGFKNLKLESMFATATVKNIRAIRAIEHAGFKKIGIRRRYHYLDGTYYDEILFDITRNDYYERKR
jgi:RimJ/RimL family protein N-acetyltransferase